MRKERWYPPRSDPCVFCLSEFCSVVGCCFSCLLCLLRCSVWIEKGCFCVCIIVGMNNKSKKPRHLFLSSSVANDELRPVRSDKARRQRQADNRSRGTGRQAGLCKTDTHTYYRIKYTGECIRKRLC